MPGPEEGRRPAAVAAALQSMQRGSAALFQLFRSRYGGKVSAAEGMVLRFLADTPGATPRAVAQFSGLTPGSITGLLDRLEEQRLVRRERSTADRRVVHLRLEPAGRRLAEEMGGAALRDLFDDWSVAELDALARLLDKLTDSARARGGDGHA